MSASNPGPISRRTFLRGAGVTMALPWLESVPGLGAARHVGQETVQPSMVLGCEQPITGYHETNFSMAYSSHISWQSATSPVPMEVYPSLAFDSLFENRGSRRNQSILDRVRDEAAGLSNQVSSADKAKLDEYLTSVREVEKR